MTNREDYVPNSIEPFFGQSVNASLSVIEKELLFSTPFCVVNRLLHATVKYV